MDTQDYAIAIFIHLLVPLTGVIAFILLWRRMRQEQVQNPPVFEMFMIFLNYGTLVVLLLTSLFWKWSGLASLGTFYLILGAPVTMVLIALRNRGKQTLSQYHRFVYRSSLAYFVIAPLSLVTVGTIGRIL